MIRYAFFLEIFVKLVNPGNPVQFSWLTEQRHRLDASPYLSGAYEARKILERLRVSREPLSELTMGHDGGIYNGPKFRRVYVTNRDHGVPFLGSTDMLEADFGSLPLLRKKDAYQLPYLEVRPGMTLISCSGTVGRMIYVRQDMEGFWSSQDVIKVNPDQKKIPPGYLYTYLRSCFGVPLITSSAYGAVIKHIEPEHIAGLPVPRFGNGVEERIHELVQEAAELRARFQAGVVAATRDLFASAGLPELNDFAWHDQPRDLEFKVIGPSPNTLRALNFSPRARRITEVLRSVPHRSLGDICEGGMLGRGDRFKRIDADGKYGIKLIGQRQAFWLRPEGRRIILNRSDVAKVQVADETVLVAARGTLGEHEVFGRSILVTGRWQKEFAFSEDFLRILSGDSTFPGAYLFAFLRSEIGFRLMRSMSAGSKQQEIIPHLCSQIPIPICTLADRERITDTVRQAYRDRDEADNKEDEALQLLDEAVREAAR